MTQEGGDNKNAYATASARWRAIVNRDAAANCFVYGVRTTKIYCRPKCPARLARRANVIFYDTPKQAETAGYRPCKRCKPEDLRVPTDPHVRLAQKACETMMLCALAGGEKQRPTLCDLAAEAGLTPSHFHRVFKKVVGLTPGKYARDLLEGKPFRKTLADGTVIGWPPAAPIGVANPPMAPQVQPPQPVQPQQQQTAMPIAAPLPDPLQGLGLDLPHPPSTGPDMSAVKIDWNAFDVMLSSHNTDLRTQTDFINGGFYVPTAEHHPFDPNTLIDGSMYNMNPQTAGPFCFPDYVNDTVDFSLGTPLFDSPALTARPTSVPSSFSQSSLSPTDSPPMFDVCDSPLMFEDPKWMENPGAGMPLTWKV